LENDMDNPVVNILSLCSGVAGLDLGLHAGLEFCGCQPRVVGYCERDAYAAAVLLARMEEKSLEPAPIWAGNLEEFPAERFRGVVDCVVAGFPCTPFSCAGKQLGTEDERWLWPAIANIIRDAQPSLVFLENVPGLLAGGGLHFVLDDLAACGFDAEWLHITAASVGASHERNRIFILGMAQSTEQRLQGRRGEHAGERLSRQGDGKLAHASKQRQGRRGEHAGERLPGPDGGELADASGGQLPGPGRGAQGRAGPDATSADVGNAEHTERRPEQNQISEPGRFNRLGRASAELFAPGPGSELWPGIIAESPWLAPATQPDFRCLAHGSPDLLALSRADALRCGGNGCVPLCAATAFVELFRRLSR
jgi:DNA (cytosine-5)-methyltransferase 1